MSGNLKLDEVAEGLEAPAVALMPADAVSPMDGGM